MFPICLCNRGTWFITNAICSLFSYRNHFCVSSYFEFPFDINKIIVFEVRKTLRNSEIFNKNLVLGNISSSSSFKFGSSFNYYLCIKFCVTPLWGSKDVCARNEIEIPTTPLFVKLQSLIKTLTPFFISSAI